MTPAQPRRRTRLAPEARRGQILDEAAGLVLDAGLYAVSLARRAGGLGVCKALVYRRRGLVRDLGCWIADDEAHLEWARTSPGVPEIDVRRLCDRDALAESRWRLQRLVRTEVPLRQSAGELLD